MAREIGRRKAYHAPSEASGAHMNPAITLTFFYLGRIRLVDLCFYIIAQVIGVFATLFVLSRLLPEPVMHPAVNYLMSMSGSAGELAAFAGEFLIAFLLTRNLILPFSFRTKFTLAALAISCCVRMCPHSCQVSCTPKYFEP